MATQLERGGAGGREPPHPAVTLDAASAAPPAGGAGAADPHRRLAAPTAALMLLQGVIAAGEAAFVGRLGSAALAGVSLSFPLVMLMTTLSAGAYGGGVASGVARALGAGKVDDAGRLAGTALGMSALLGLASTAAMLLFGRALYAALGATGPALEAAVLYSDILFLGAVPFWLSSAAASIPARRRQCGDTRPSPVPSGALSRWLSPRWVIFGAGTVPGWDRRARPGRWWAYNGAMAAVRPPAGGMGLRLAGTARLGRPLVPRWWCALRDPSGLGACARSQHAADQPDVHHPDRPGRTVWGGGDCRVRCRGASGIPDDPHRFRCRLGS